MTTRTYTTIESDTVKTCTGPGYSYHFNKVTGHFARWGDTLEEDPTWAPPGPEILDIEITDKCRGVRDLDGVRIPCGFCYKSNGPGGRNHMTLDTFKVVLSKMGSQLTQMALGVDAECTANPDTFAIMRHARDLGVIPNVTVADITPETADALADLCGAVAVSFYPERDKNRCYDTVKLLTDRGMKQTNVHCLLSSDRFPAILELLNDRVTDPRLAGLNAIVFLSLKKKGRGVRYERLGFDRFKEILDVCFRLGIAFGFDSCSFPLFERSIRGRPDYDRLMGVAEPCESGVFSSYIDVTGRYFPCSFYAGTPGWEEGIDVLACDSFLDVWNSERVVKERKRLLDGCRACPIYDI
jgi:MoaA/NifB/PqqE/SkfB family radical SAM enzyme